MQLQNPSLSSPFFFIKEEKILTELIKMMNRQFGRDLCRKILKRSKLSTPRSASLPARIAPRRWKSLFFELSQETGFSIPNLLRAFGRHLFLQFSWEGNEKMEAQDNAFDFLEILFSSENDQDRHTYCSVLPTQRSIKMGRRTSTEFFVSFCFSRWWRELIYGFVEGALQHFCQPGLISMNYLTEGGEDKIQIEIYCRAPLKARRVPSLCTN